jgi:hypothetical protein
MEKFVEWFWKFFIDIRQKLDLDAIAAEKMIQRLK